MTSCSQFADEAVDVEPRRNCSTAFVRITTHPRLYDHPLTAEQALDSVDAWLGAPPVLRKPSVTTGAARNDDGPDVIVRAVVD